MVINLGDTNVKGGNRHSINFETDSRRDIARTLRGVKNDRIFEAHERLRQQRQEQDRERRSRRRRTGSVRLSNADSVARAQKIRGQLQGKLSEVMSSDMDDRSKKALAIEIQTQIDRVDQQIAAMRRREQAMREEKQRRRSEESAQERRRRNHDIQERSIFIRDDFLHPASRGGLNPADFMQSSTSSSSAPVSFSISGSVGTADFSMDSGGGLEVTF